MDPFHSHDMKYLLSFPIALLKTGILTLLFMVGFHCIKLLHIFISYEINESSDEINEINEMFILEASNMLSLAFWQF